MRQGYLEATKAKSVHLLTGTDPAMPQLNQGIQPGGVNALQSPPCQIATIAPYHLLSVLTRCLGTGTSKPKSLHLKLGT